MSKAFTRETDAETDDLDDAEEASTALPGGRKNYLTPAGAVRLRAELLQLMDSERPAVVEAVHWAAKNGDRSENGDYLYGKKRLREIDRRIRFLTKRLEIAEVVDASVHHGGSQVFFGATVRVADDTGGERELAIVGVDEVRHGTPEISWISPVAQALLGARTGDVVRVATPGGTQELEVLAVDYPPPA